MNDRYAGDRADRVHSRPPVSEVWVVVPAHNEEEHIAASLEAILRSARAAGVPFTVTVVLDDCTDRTADRIPTGVRSVVVSERSAGAARRAGMLGAPAGRGVWYATTDADSLVPVHWLSTIIASADEHDVVAGTIRVADWAGRDDRVRQHHDHGYRARAGHGHIHGANLAVSAAAYHHVGGFRPMPEHEDVDLVSRCLAAGLVVDWSDSAPVITSARRFNRVGGGFGGLLNRLEEGLTP
ncbi:glycosyltransferase [Ammonicoccus fulvus]|uniref:4,4'-diaponeurosporenoate glycosyltransferase n=1 Tax=Ammonicoccus fulvus TaxID=3138240 RepID=A0ABZ3FK90_9ACTN